MSKNFNFVVRKCVFQSSLELVGHRRAKFNRRTVSFLTAQVTSVVVSVRRAKFSRLSNFVRRAKFSRLSNLVTVSYLTGHVESLILL